MTLATMRSLAWARSAIAVSGSARAAVAAIVSWVLSLGTMLSHLIAGLLALGRRHLAPAFRVPLEALALLGAHGLIALKTFLDLLLLLLR